MATTPDLKERLYGCLPDARRGQPSNGSAVGYVRKAEWLVGSEKR